MTCNDICHRYKTSKPVRGSSYSEGKKRCSHCDIFMEWDGVFCPCCRFQLRSSPRIRKYKERIATLKRV